MDNSGLWTVLQICRKTGDWYHLTEHTDLDFIDEHFSEFPWDIVTLLGRVDINFIKRHNLFHRNSNNYAQMYKIMHNGLMSMDDLLELGMNKYISNCRNLTANQIRIWMNDFSRDEWKYIAIENNDPEMVYKNFRNHIQAKHILMNINCSESLLRTILKFELSSNNVISVKHVSPEFIRRYGASHIFRRIWRGVTECSRETAIEIMRDLDPANDLNFIFSNPNIRQLDISGVDPRVNIFTLTGNPGVTLEYIMINIIASVGHVHMVNPDLIIPVEFISSYSAILQRTLAGFGICTNLEGFIKYEQDITQFKFVLNNNHKSNSLRSLLL